MGDVGSSFRKKWKKVQTDIYSISGAIGTQNRVKLYLIIITLCLSNQVVCFFKAIAFKKNILWVTEHYYVLACLKRWSYNKTQLPKLMIRSMWCIATRGNVSKVCILKVFETIWNCREKMRTMSLKNAFWHFLKRFGTADFFGKTMALKHVFGWYLKRLGNADFLNNVYKTCILMIFETIWNCREKYENNVYKACTLTVFE